MLAPGFFSSRPPPNPAPAGQVPDSPPDASPAMPNDALDTGINQDVEHIVAQAQNHVTGLWGGAADASTAAATQPSEAPNAAESKIAPISLPAPDAETETRTQVLYHMLS